MKDLPEVRSTECAVMCLTNQTQSSPVFPERVSAPHWNSLNDDLVMSRPKPYTQRCADEAELI